jgi:hypothetical protein
MTATLNPHSAPSLEKGEASGDNVERARFIFWGREKRKGARLLTKCIGHGPDVR